MCTKYGRHNIYSIIKNYPRLDLKGRMGGTDYIDFLRWNEVNHPVMWGIDRYNRLFFVIKGYVNGKRVLQTFFQRYTGLQSAWNSGGGDIILN
jgi:hypothetical protein